MIVIKQHNKKGIKFITGDLYINFKLGFITYEKKENAITKENIRSEYLFSISHQKKGINTIQYSFD